MSEYLSILSKVNLFQDLDEPTLTEIAAKGEEITVMPDNRICHRGEAGAHFFIVLKGQVRIVISGENDDLPPTLLKIHGPAGFFGEMSLLTGDPISADVIASEESTLLRLSKDQFESIFTRNTSVLLRLNKTLAQNLSATNTMVRPMRFSKIFGLHRVGDALKENFTGLYMAGSMVKQTAKRVLLIDFESTYFGVLDRLGLKPQRDPYGVFEHGRAFTLLNDFRPHCIKLSDRLDVLSFPEPLSKRDDISLARLQDLQGIIRRLYDSILIDTGTASHQRGFRILGTCDRIYIITPEQPGYAPLTTALKALDLTASQLTKRLRIGVVCDKEPERRSKPLDPLLEATGCKNLFILSNHHVNNLHMSKDLTPVVDEGSMTGRRIASLAREIAGTRVGLALGSGGAKGFAHIGVMRLLEETGVPCDMIVGCSMGAIIGACFALGNDSVEVEETARRLWAQKGAFFDWQIPPWANIVKGKKVDRMADRGFEGATVLDCPIPYAAMGFDLITGQEVVIDEGTLKNAVRASGSMPGIMRPVKWKGMYLIDGGVSNKVPVDVLAGTGTDLNIAVNVAPEVDPGFYDIDNPRKPGLLGKFMGIFSRNMREMYREPNIVQIMARTYSTSATKLTEAHLHLAHVNIRPDTDGIGMLDFLKLDEAIEAGIEATRQHVDEIKSKYRALCGFE